MFLRNLSVLSSLAMFLAIHSCRHPEKENAELPVAGNWQFRQADSGNWLPASVPGCVHTDLLSNKLIADPFYRTNEKDLQWIDKKDWEYRCEFPVDEAVAAKKHIELHFKGLDTYARVYLNDSLILTADNMFREWTVSCRNHIHAGLNTLRIVFESPIRRGLELFHSQGYDVPVSDNDLSELGGLGKKHVSVFTRKAGYHYGWDWGPRLVTSGIWRPVVIRAWNKAVFRNIHIEQNAVDTNEASISAVLTVESDAPASANIAIRINGNKTASQEVKLAEGINRITIPVTIANPELWWPNGLGRQTMYNIAARLESDKKLADEISTRTGLRTVEIVQEPDSAGKSFYFKINGVPVFMKGANYIPQDIFITRVDKNRYAYMVRSAAEANMNMLRVWGGGIYSDDTLYDLCDESGILVWQDFMFACSLFPNYPGYLDNIAREAADNVVRLRNHPCIALWCGNNECLDAMNWAKKPQWHKEQTYNMPVLEKTYDTIFHHILSQAVSSNDPKAFYWSSSPSAAPGVAADWKSGDVHYWGVWWGKEPFSNYQRKTARFMSEYGYQSFPEMSAVKQYSIESDWDIYSEVMKHHQRSSIGNGTIDLYMNWYYNKPRDFASFLYVNHVLQAEGISMAIESHRANMPYCMGSLYWQIDDCWPVASWSGIDYYGNWKALHYFAKKAFEPVHAVLIRLDKKISAYIVSDQLNDNEGVVELKAMTLAGKMKWEKKINIKAAANTSTRYLVMDENEITTGNDTCDLLLYARFISKGKMLTETHLFFAAPRNLKLPEVSLKPEIKINETQATITFQTERLTKNVYLVCDKASFSDNYFDLLPGETKTITATVRKGEKLNKDDIVIRSLRDTY